MRTMEAILLYLKNCEERGLSRETLRTGYSFLRQFGAAYPELPIDTRVIEEFLAKRGEIPTHRRVMFKRLRNFYSYLERNNGIKSPVPRKGPVGRPRKFLRGPWPEKHTG